MKTDRQLQKDVGEELAWEPQVTASQIGVHVKNAAVWEGICMRHASGFGPVALSLALTLVPLASHAQRDMFPVPPRLSAAARDGGTRVPSSMKNDLVADSNSSLFEPTGNPDRDFANRMSAHHQEGVDMAKAELANGKSTKMRAMARRIIKDQEQEIVELDKWSARHNVRVSGDDRRPTFP